MVRPSSIRALLPVRRPAEFADAGTVPQGHGRCAVRHRQLLAGSRRARRRAAERDHHQAPIQRARPSAARGAPGGDSRARRQSVHRIPGARGRDQTQAGLRTPDPPQGRHVVGVSGAAVRHPARRRLLRHRFRGHVLHALMDRLRQGHARERAPVPVLGHLLPTFRAPEVLAGRGRGAASVPRVDLCRQLSLGHPSVGALGDIVYLLALSVVAVEIGRRRVTRLLAP